MDNVDICIRIKTLDFYVSLWYNLKNGVNTYEFYTSRKQNKCGGGKLDYF